MGTELEETDVLIVDGANTLWRACYANAGLGYLGGVERGYRMVERLRYEPNRLLEMSSLMRGRIDGYGVDRLARLIEEAAR